MDAININTFSETNRAGVITFRHVCGEIFHARATEQDVLFFPRFDRQCTGQPVTICRLCEEIIDLDWLRPLYIVEPMPRALAINTASNKNCSNCWQHGFIFQDVEVLREDGTSEKMLRVLCATCLEETRGYVSTHYIGRALEQDRINWRASFEGIYEALGIEPPAKKRRTTEEILAELF
jgi:hypothetical protein